MKTSRILVSLIIVSGLILIAALSIGLYTSNEIKNRTTDINNQFVVAYDYHIMMLINKDDDTYSEQFFEGVNSASEGYNIAVETIFIEDEAYLRDVIDRMDMAIYSKVDGIVVHAYDNPEIMDKIEQANDSGIPVVTLNENTLSSKQISYAGTNRYNIGLNIGKTIANLTSGRGEIAVVDKINFKPDDASSEDQMVKGLREIFSGFNSLDLKLIRHTQVGVLSAEAIATEIVEDYNNIDVIMCTDPQSTLGIVQVLIDRNKVNEFTVVGFGDDPEILQYIQSGAIDATLVIDNRSIGKAAVTALYEYMSSGIVTADFSASFLVIDRKNIDNYLNEKESEDED